MRTLRLNLEASSKLSSLWKAARVASLPKSKIRINIDEFRPISTLPTILKIVTHLIKDQVSQATRASIHESQYAFRSHEYQPIDHTFVNKFKVTEDFRNAFYSPLYDCLATYAVNLPAYTPSIGELPCCSKSKSVAL
uniref:Reverse transcriptase domain-containing protein n=1 Tax=Glossina pallidipes TaxID=7398 RepID=A0A1A9ZAR5_GLOPL